MIDLLSYAMGKAAGDGGGGDITVEPLSVTENGTKTAPSGKAYSPVTVNVPNSYTASDEGKVVSNGALVAQTSDTVTANDTYDTTLINSLTVNVSGGGGVARTSGTLTFAERTSYNGYQLDVGIDAAQFAIYATTDPLQSNGRTFQGNFIDFAASTEMGTLFATSNSAGSSGSGGLTSNNTVKSGTVLTFVATAGSMYGSMLEAGITYQWYAWGRQHEIF